MGDLAQDTAVVGADGRFSGTLSPDWEIWGPNGGYLAAVALRAAGAHSGRARPASAQCHFLDVASFDRVELTVETLRQSWRAQSMRVSMAQEGRRVLEALVWAVDDGLDGLVHEHAPAPTVPSHDGLAPIDELFTDGDPRPRFPFFDNLEERPVHWIADWERRPKGEPVHRCWYRFRQAGEADAWVEAGRLAVLVDTFQWPAAVRGHAGGTVAHRAPSLDLACLFHRTQLPPGSWCLVEARSPIATGGLVGGSAQVWDEAGRLLASGGQQMLCRPAPGFA